jgi:hypothetical protein
MIIEPVVCFPDELPVKPSFVFSFFIPSQKQYRLPVGIKNECYAPNANSGVQSQFFHIGMA